MTRHEFDRQVFGDTAPPTEIDYDFYRREAVRLRRGAMARILRRAGSLILCLPTASSRLFHHFVRPRAHDARHQDMRPQDT